MNLTSRQYEVTRAKATEPAYSREFWDHPDAGTYVDVGPGGPLFANCQRLDSGYGWPRFTRPLRLGDVVEVQDHRIAMSRTEVGLASVRAILATNVTTVRPTTAACDTASTRRPYAL